MTKTYTFSAYVKAPEAQLVRRKWWNLFGSDTIAYESRWTRRVVRGLSEVEANALTQEALLQEGWGSLFLKALGAEVNMIQLEEDSREAAHVASGYVAEEARANLLKRSVEGVADRFNGVSKC